MTDTMNIDPRPENGYAGTEHDQAAGSPHIRIEDLYFAYGSRLILKDISLTVPRGEVVALIGPSGCGKSTLLKLVQGIIQPSFGSVSIEGEQVSGPSGDRATIFQQFGLLPWKTVLNNVLYGTKYRRAGANKLQRTEEAMEWIHRVGLAGFENHFPRQLSGGMQQRVGIARAFSIRPSVLLLDEPFGAVDAQNAEIMRGELMRLVAETACTAMLVTHNLDEALDVADRVVVMGAHPGVIKEDVRVDAPRGEDGCRAEWRHTSEHRELREQMWATLRAEVLRTQKPRETGSES